MRLECHPELTAAVVEAGGTGAARALRDAVARAEKQLEHLLNAFGCPEPTAGELVLVPASDRPDPGAPVDPGRLAGYPAARMATVLLAAALDAIGEDPALTAATEPGPPTGRGSRADAEATATGAELDGLPETELILYYRPHGSMPRSGERAVLDETAEVEDRITAAIEGLSGAAIVDKSGWQWRVSIP